MKNLTLLLLLLFIFVSSFSQEATKEEQIYIEKYAKANYAKQIDAKQIDKIKKDQYVIGYTINGMKVDIITDKYVVMISHIKDWNHDARILAGCAKEMNKEPIILYLIGDADINNNHPSMRVPQRRDRMKVYTINKDFKIKEIAPPNGE